SERQGRLRYFGGIHGACPLAALTDRRRRPRDMRHVERHHGMHAPISRIREFESRPPTGTALDSAPNLSELGHLTRPPAKLAAWRLRPRYRVPFSVFEASSWSACMAMRSGFGIGCARPPATNATRTCASASNSPSRV